MQMKLTKKQIFWLWLIIGILEVLTIKIKIREHDYFFLAISCLTIPLSIYTVITYWKFK